MTIEGAEYHVKESFPKDDVEFLRSGNWKFFITDPQDTSIVYDWGEFYVVENLVELKTNIQDWRREGRISGNSALDRVLNLKVNFQIPDSLSPFKVKYVKLKSIISITFSVCVFTSSLKDFIFYPLQ